MQTTVLLLSDWWGCRDDGYRMLELQLEAFDLYLWNYIVSSAKTCCGSFVSSSSSVQIINFRNVNSFVVPLCHYPHIPPPSSPWQAPNIPWPAPSSSPARWFPQSRPNAKLFFLMPRSVRSTTIDRGSTRSGKAHRRRPTLGCENFVKYYFMSAPLESFARHCRLIVGSSFLSTAFRVFIPLMIAFRHTHRDELVVRG